MFQKLESDLYDQTYPTNFSKIQIVNFASDKPPMNNIVQELREKYIVVHKI